MPPDAISRAQMAPYFSRLDTKVPFRNSLVGMAVNLIFLPIALVPSDPTTALVLVVLAYVVSRWVMVVNAQVCLRRDGLAPRVRTARTLGAIVPPVLLAAATMVGLTLSLDLNGRESGPPLVGLVLLTAAAGVAALVGMALLQRRPLAALLATPTTAEASAGEQGSPAEPPR
jgi:peptidoglycan biosynthesis protein MviN/MurJ (putative lipid II flippase)